MSSKTGKKVKEPPPLISEEDKISVEKRKELSKEASLYYKDNNVPQSIQLLLNEMFFKKPKDVNGYISRFFSSRALNPTIHHFELSNTIDANCNPATKVSLFAIIEGECELVAESTVSDNFGSGEEESKSSLIASKNNLGEQQISEDVPPSITDQATNNRDIVKLLNTTLGGKDLSSIKECLDIISVSSTPSQPHPPQTSLLLALSQSLISGLSNSTGTPLYETIAGICTEDIPTEYTGPHPLYHMLDGTGGKCKLADFLITISPSVQVLEGLRYAQSFYDKLRGSVKLSAPLMYDGALRYNIDKLEQGIELLTETGKGLELNIGEDVFIVVNSNAGVRWESEKSKYEVNSGQWKSSQELVELYNEIIRNYPSAVLGIFNAFYEGDTAGYSVFNKTHPSILLFQNNSESIEKIRTEIKTQKGEDDNMEETGNTNSLVLSKYIEMPLYSWIEDAKKRENELGFALKHQPDTEVCSCFNVDLITGLQGSFIQVGSPRDKGTSLCISRILNIEEELKRKKIMKNNKQLLKVFTGLRKT